jgi:predicted transport protein
MNERIRELAEQVDKEFNSPYDRYKAIERFAELIVAECILTIQMGITRDGPNTEKYLRSMKHIKQIREHFGVEE